MQKRDLSKDGIRKRRRRRDYRTCGKKVFSVRMQHAQGSLYVIVIHNATERHSLSGSASAVRIRSLRRRCRGTVGKTRQASVPLSSSAYTEFCGAMTSIAVVSRAWDVTALPLCTLFNESRPKPPVFMRANIDGSRLLSLSFLFHVVFMSNLLIRLYYIYKLNAVLSLSVRRGIDFTITLTS